MKWSSLRRKILHLFCSAINPILYNAMSDKFRKAFRTFLVCCGGRRRNAFGFVDEPLLVIRSSRQPTICYRFDVTPARVYHGFGQA